ncbi:CBS domain-containing protein [Bradyrhizobium sp. CCGE-LA001]|uniref:CBS domain-containing protein n=1 Tax=Bradyrhizobium sp. CCGE-LA001 TaxID=1223566 RepID=UPI000745BE49|nr:CBS domain-containing protein [Bradyrhizobium sp. CCGE-LA001]AMA61536.1 transcriptional regulator [Bradyrhizobium sp. CCGE-LA001]
MYKFLEQIVADYMTRKPRTVGRDTTMRELGELFKTQDFNAYPAIDGEQVLGIVSKLDYLSCFVFSAARMSPRYPDLMQRTVADVMSSEFIYVAPDTRLTRVLELMVNYRLRSVPVLDADQRLAGIISREDVIHAVQDCT